MRSTPPWPGMRHALRRSPRCANGSGCLEIRILRLEVTPAKRNVEKRREILKLKIKALFEANNERIRVPADDRPRCAAAATRPMPETVRRLMRELGWCPCQPRPWRHSLTEQAAWPATIPDLVSRDFTAEKPGQKMVGDITYIPTWQGWLYLATVIDCATRKIVGWAMDDNYRTPLIITAVKMAARNVDTPGQDAVFHSDRGSNYTSPDVRVRR